MGRHLIDIRGQRFGRLVIIDHPYKSKKWNCICDCGNAHAASGSSIRAGNTRSCGCLNSELSAKRKTTHGMCHFPEHAVWSSMKERCFYKKSERFNRYGGRGIKICKRWLGVNGFKNFLTDMGIRPSPKHSIERRNTNGNYQPSNCKWATIIDQANNHTNNRRVDAFGENHTVAEWCRNKKLRYGLVMRRLEIGWNAERALTEFVHNNGVKRGLV